MVEVKYSGGLGNKLFQYCFGRIIAEKLGFKLKAEPIPGFPNTEIEVDGADYSSYSSDTPLGEEPDWSKKHKVDLCSILLNKRKRKIIIEGFFQRYEYYQPYKDVIRTKWLRMDTPPDIKLSPEDVVLHVRRGDYVGIGCALPYSYYEHALRKINQFGKLYICTDDIKDPFLSNFDKYRPRILCSGEEPTKDFRLMMSSNIIVQSASSFSWWASFLSRADKIYAPTPSFGFWSSEYPDVDLKVCDEERYIYMPCNERYKLTRKERLDVLKNKLLIRPLILAKSKFDALKRKIKKTNEKND